MSISSDFAVKLRDWLLRWRWWIAAAAALLVIVVELGEHGLASWRYMDSAFWRETILFGVVGPLLIGGTLTALQRAWLERTTAVVHVGQQRALSEQLARIQDWDELTDFIVNYPRSAEILWNMRRQPRDGDGPSPAPAVRGQCAVAALGQSLLPAADAGQLAHRLPAPLFFDGFLTLRPGGRSAGRPRTGDGGGCERCPSAAFGRHPGGGRRNGTPAHRPRPARYVGPKTEICLSFSLRADGRIEKRERR
jgi:hypothetical protein